MRDSTQTMMFQRPDATARHPKRTTRLARRVAQALALSTVLLLAACSSIKLGYNNADTLLVYSLDSYLDLDESQERLARDRVRELLSWHRSTQLHAYARFLDDTERKVGNGSLTADDVLVFQQAMNEKMMKVGEQAAPELARLALTLQPAQVDHLANKLAKDTSKARREFLKLAGKESLDDRVKAYAGRTETWFGSLSKEQLELVRASLGSRPSGQQLWMEERERRQRDLVSVLRRIVEEKPAELIATQWLRDYFAQLAQPADEARRARVQENRRNNAQLIAQLINSATPAQKATLAKKLRGYAQDFTTLASANGARS
jgi:hypothetical protein